MYYRVPIAWVVGVVLSMFGIGLGYGAYGRPFAMGAAIAGGVLLTILRVFMYARSSR